MTNKYLAIMNAHMFRRSALKDMFSISSSSPDSAARGFRTVRVRCTAHQGLAVTRNVEDKVPSYPLSRGTVGHPLSWGHKYGDLVLQVGGWARGHQPLSVKHDISRNVKNRRPRPDIELLRPSRKKLIKIIIICIYFTN
jgi:hypothetical protein